MEGSRDLAPSPDAAKMEKENNNNSVEKQSRDGESSDEKITYPSIFIRVVVVVSLMLATFLVLHLSNAKLIHALTFFITDCIGYGTFGINTSSLIHSLTLPPEYHWNRYSSDYNRVQQHGGCGLVRQVSD